MFREIEGGGGVGGAKVHKIGNGLNTGGTKCTPQINLEKIPIK